MKVARIINFILAGFPSPWRMVRRRYWRWVFDRCSEKYQFSLVAIGVDPENLIKKGRL